MGGGFAFFNSLRVSSSLKNCSIQKNKAEVGGAIYIERAELKSDSLT